MRLSRFLAAVRPPAVWRWPERAAWRDGFFAGYLLGATFAALLSYAVSKLIQGLP